jgi:hypothetical protein
MSRRTRISKEEITSSRPKTQEKKHARMNTPEIVNIGIDVSKERLDISPFDGKTVQIPNTAAGINGLIKRVKALGRPALLCCEATGGYERLLLESVSAAGIPIAQTNPAHVRFFAKSRGQRKVRTQIPKTTGSTRNSWPTSPARENPRPGKLPPRGPCACVH